MFNTESHNALFAFAKCCQSGFEKTFYTNAGLKNRMQLKKVDILYNMAINNAWN